MPVTFCTFPRELSSSSPLWSEEVHFMRKPVRASAFATLFAVAGSLLPSFATAQEAPQSLQPPANEHVLRQVHAKGNQIYSCHVDGAQSTWTLKAPEAQLSDKDGKSFGKHFAGPSWKANDGSQVTGKAIVNVPSPDPNSIPWLLVAVVSRSGVGVLAGVTSIQRLNTRGGKAPASGCDAAHVGRERRVRYSADYVFFAAQ
jgi:hypothetical protein